MHTWCHLSTGFRRRRILHYAVYVSIIVALITTLVYAEVAQAAQSTNRTISFQGRLQTSAGAIVPDGNYNIQFKIYQDGTGTAVGNPGGSLEWTETYINNGADEGVEVRNGFFSVSLGSVSSFGTSIDWDSDALFLSMNVAGRADDCVTFGTAPCAADGEMLPMKQLTAAPYAINSGAVGGKTVDQLIQNTTSLQADSNIALQSASDSEITAYIEGRTNQTSSNLVIKQGASQSGKAIEVQSSSGGDYFSIDATGTLNQVGDASIGGKLGVGTTTPGRALDVAVNDSSTNSLPVRIAQQGTGDTGIELSANGSGKYSIGIDASDGSFKVASSIAGGLTSTLGDTAVGASNSTGNYQSIQAQKLTADSTGSVINMSVHMASIDSFCPGIQLGVYADNGSGTAPSTLLGKSEQSDAAVGWNTTTLTSTVNLTSGTAYWLAIATECDSNIKLTTGVGTRAFMSGATLPDTFASETTGSGQLSLYATIDTSAGNADSFGGSAPILNMGPTGNTTFKNSVDSTSAFQVQNSAGDDVLSVNTDDGAGAVNVQIGTGSGSGTPSLLTLDKAATAPTIEGDTLLGSMYYDTTLGKVQCYEESGWGSCGDSPDNFVTISPEYANAVMNGTDIGTISSDLCSDELNINDGSSSQPTVCGTDETQNYYAWTSAETSAQTRSIYITYKLPGTFKEFVPGSTSLVGRTDSADSSVTYQLYRDVVDEGLASCGSVVPVSTGVQTTWQTVTTAGGVDPASCGFEAGDSILIRINLSAHDDANAYVSDLNFAFSNN